MKLLLDQNISYRLVKELESRFPGTQQFKRLGLNNTSDREIWAYARKENYVLIPFDSDFYDFSIAFGHPPKVIWLKFSNQASQNVLNILLSKAEQIEDFNNNNELSCLEIFD